MTPENVQEIVAAAAGINYQRTREMTIDELLLENRIVFMIGEINQGSAARCMMQMLYLESQKRGQEISLYINSPGGYVSDGLAIYDTMQFVQCDIATYCIGQAMSMGALLLAAGTKGKRFILPHARVMLHQPSGGAGGTAADIERHAEEILKLRREMNEIFAKHTGQSVSRVEADSDRDFFLDAQGAKEYGLVDEVIRPLRG